MAGFQVICLCGHQVTLPAAFIHHFPLTIRKDGATVSLSSCITSVMRTIVRRSGIIADCNRVDDGHDPRQSADQASTGLSAPDLERSRLALLRAPPNGQIARASPFAEGSRGAELPWRVRGRSPRACLAHPIAPPSAEPPSRHGHGIGLSDAMKRPAGFSASGSAAHGLLD
jgi:hypothetical protein